MIKEVSSTIEIFMNNGQRSCAMLWPYELYSKIFYSSPGQRSDKLNIY